MQVITFIVLAHLLSMGFQYLVYYLIHLLCCSVSAHVRDPNNVPHTIRNLKIMVRDMNSQPPQLAVSRKMMSDAVSNAYPQNAEPLGRGNVVVVGDYDLQLSSEL